MTGSQLDVMGCISSEAVAPRSSTLIGHDE